MTYIEPPRGDQVQKGRRRFPAIKTLAHIMCSAKRVRWVYFPKLQPKEILWYW